MADRPEPAGVLVGSLPYMVGYTLTPRHVVMVAFDDDGRNGPIGCVDWAEGEDAGRSLMAMAEDTAAVLGRVIRGTRHRQVVLIGYAQSNARVSTLMRNIEASPWLEKPQLVEIKAVTVDKRRLNEFSMNAAIKRTSAQEGGKK